MNFLVLVKWGILNLVFTFFSLVLVLVSFQTLVLVPSISAYPLSTDVADGVLRQHCQVDYFDDF